MAKQYLPGIFLALILSWGTVDAAGFKYSRPSEDVPRTQWETVVGWVSRHTVVKKETLLDIARNHELGYNEIEILYPDMDPWVPEPGTELTIPVCWILPSSRSEGIVINIPELRLYRFIDGKNMVETYPVGIGTEEYETPLGQYRVVDRQKDPEWVVPPSLRDKYSFRRMAPGPRNPLGRYWLGLSAKHIGIHGTNFPWAVGRQVSRGCIRLYPEHIERLFPEVVVGTSVEIVYEPVKWGFLNGEIYVEVHPDSDGRETNFEKIAMEHLRKLGDGCYVSSDCLEQALKDRNGVPTRVGHIREGEGEGTLHADYHHQLTGEPDGLIQ